MISGPPRYSFNEAAGVDPADASDEGNFIVLFVKLGASMRPRG